MSDIKTYRESDQEKARTSDLLHLLPQGRRSVLDIGARDGHFSRVLTEHFDEVTALDLEKPDFSIQRVTTLAGDVTNLQFADDSFDCVFCAEVLEHVPEVVQACREIARVARHEIVIGVPYKQDTRLGRTTCRSCGHKNPPWGHVNRFDEQRLAKLFHGLTIKAMSFVGLVRDATNPISTFLMDMAGNPWGTYDQDEQCIYCGGKLTPPAQRSIYSRVCSGVAIRINRVQSVFTQAHGNWIHVLFSKDGHR